MYHYEKKLDATYKHYQHHPYVKENKKKGGTRVQKQRYMVKQKKQMNGITSLIIFLYSQIFKTATDTATETVTERLTPCKPHTPFYEIRLDELNNAQMTIIPFVRSSSATSYT